MPFESFFKKKESPDLRHDVDAAVESLLHYESASDGLDHFSRRLSGEKMELAVKTIAEDAVKGKISEEKLQKILERVGAIKDNPKTESLSRIYGAFLEEEKRNPKYAALLRGKPYALRERADAEMFKTMYG